MFCEASNDVERIRNAGIVTIVESLVVPYLHKWINLSVGVKAVRVHCFVIVYVRMASRIFFISPHLKNFGLSRKILFDSGTDMESLLCKFQPQLSFRRVVKLTNIAASKIARVCTRLDVEQNFRYFWGFETTKDRCVKLKHTAKVDFASLVGVHCSDIIFSFLNVIHFERFYQEDV
jgi:hypothetical protein